MDWVVILALMAQLADGALTCSGLRAGGREVNPLILVPSCKGVVVQKAATTLPLMLLRGKAKTAWGFGLILGSGVGIAFTLGGRQ